MKKYLFKLIAVLLPVLGLLFFSGCSSSDGPVKLNELNIIDLNYDEETGDTQFFIDFTNTSEDGVLDTVEITFEGKFGEGYENESSIRYRILDNEGWAPGEGRQSLEKIPGLIKGERYTAYVSKAVFTDGTVWTGKGGKLKRTVNGTKGKGMPASLEECNYYAQRGGATDRDLNVEWINKGDEPLRGVVYEISARGTDGKALKDENGNARTIYFEYFTRHMTEPGMSASDYHLVLSGSKYPWITDAEFLDVRIVQAISFDGTVYEDSKAAPLKAYYAGKKAYAFSENKNSSLKALEKKLRENLNKAGVKVAEASVYVRENDFAVFRYDDLDVRVELDENGGLIPDAASYVYYFYYSDYASRLDPQAIDPVGRDIALCVFKSMISELKGSEVEEIVNKYYAMAYTVRRDFDERGYDWYWEGSVILDTEGERILCGVNALMKDLDYSPMDVFFWAHGRPY